MENLKHVMSPDARGGHTHSDFVIHIVTEYCIMVMLSVGGLLVVEKANIHQIGRAVAACEGLDT